MQDAQEIETHLSGDLFLNRLPTDFGNILVGILNDKVCFVSFEGEERFKEWRSRYAPQAGVSREDIAHPVFSQIREYLDGKRQVFSVEFELTGTAFQKSVYTALLEIPYGATLSYGELGRKLGDPNLGRAVGNANGQNPIALIFPCHRVVGSDGKLRGFAGGVPVKKALLGLEYKHTTTQLDLLSF